MRPNKSGKRQRKQQAREGRIGAHRTRLVVGPLAGSVATVTIMWASSMNEPDWVSSTAKQPSKPTSVSPL